MKIPKGNAEDYEPDVDEGVYRVALIGIADIYERAHFKDPTKMVAKTDLTFTVIEDEDGYDDFKGKELVRRALTLSQFNQAAMYPYLCALEGRKITDEDDIDLDDYLGKEIMVEVVHAEVTRDGKTGTYMNLENPRPIRKRRPRREGNDDMDDDGFPVEDEAA